MSTYEELCSYCSKIPFDPNALDALATSEAVEFSLGPLSRIHESRCPVCRLFKLCLYENYRTGQYVDELDDSKIMELNWYSGLGPGYRGAFVPIMQGDYEICFAAKPYSPNVVEDAFYLQPIVHSELDVSRVTQWLRTCETQHSGRCSWNDNRKFRDAFPGLKFLRFVDVLQECLVETRKPKRYVALSYVWGNVNSLRLTTANREQLLAPGSIKERLYLLPTTIKDAIVLVRKLGLRYLWVDSLCLLQNDRDDVAQGVQVMDLIYEQSWFTIIAAHGHDANSGLPGVRPYSRKTSKLTLEVKPGVSLGVYSNLDQLMKPTAYLSRGWTFQEHVLCRRAIYFVDNKVFFRCANAVFSEGCIDYRRTVQTGGIFASQLTMASVMEKPLLDYAIMVSAFSEKSFTNDSDVLRAMTGVMRRISDKIGTKFLQGMPTIAMDSYVIFERGHRNIHRRSGFPSYSWAGWRGPITMHRESLYSGWGLKETWILWHKRDPSGKLDLIWDPDLDDSKPLNGKTQVSQPPRNGYFDLATSTRILAAYTAPTERLNLVGSIPSYPLLQFWTMSGFYKLSDIGPFNGACSLEGTDGEEYGRMTLDGFEELSFFNTSEPLEFILLSEGNHINVMLIEWSGGIAERRGMGWVRHGALLVSFSPGLLWKEIVLG